MEKFSKITHQKINEAPQPKIEKVNEEEILKYSIMKLMDDFLKVQLYGPMTGYYVAGTVKVAGKELFLEALLNLLEEASTKGKIKLLESLKSESSDWKLIDDKIDEIQLELEKISDGKLNLHIEKIKSLYDKYKNDKEMLMQQIDLRISNMKSGRNAFWRGVAAEHLSKTPEYSQSERDIMKKIANKYYFRSKQLGFNLPT